MKFSLATPQAKILAARTSNKSASLIFNVFKRKDAHWGPPQKHPRNCRSRSPRHFQRNGWNCFEVFRHALGVYLQVGPHETPTPSASPQNPMGFAASGSRSPHVSLRNITWTLAKTSFLDVLSILLTKIEWQKILWGVPFNIFNIPLF